MLGKIAISAICTVTAWLTLSLTGVPYALTLALVMGFFDLIPLGARAMNTQPPEEKHQ